MSSEEARAFVKDARLDKALWQALKNYETSQEVGPLLAFGYDRGYDFTAEEIKQAVALHWDRTPPPVPATSPEEKAQEKDNGWAGPLLRAMIIFGALTAIFMFAFYRSYRQYADLRDHGRTTNGWVTERGWEQWIGRRISWGKQYYVVVKYEANGHAYTIKDNVSQVMFTYYDYGFSDSATIVYDPDHPATARVESSNAPDYLMLLVTLGFGVAFLVALAAFVHVRRGPRVLKPWWVL